MWNGYSGENCSSDHSVNNRALQQNSIADTKRTADYGLQLWDQRIRYKTKRPQLTTPIQAGQTGYGQARIDEPQEPQSMQYTDGPESLSVFQQEESTDGVQDDIGCGIYTESVSGESSYAMNGQPNDRLQAIPAGVTMQSFERQTHDYEHQVYEPYTNSNLSGANSYHTGEGSPSIAMASPESSISSIESDIKLGGSAKDFASPTAEQLEDYREKKRLCRESFKDAGIEDGNAIELSKKLLCFPNVTNKVKCLSCKIEADMSWEIIHKPGCLTNIIQGDEDYPPISVGPQRSTAEVGNGYLPQLSDSDVSMESLSSERNGSPDEFREESTPYKAPYKENTCGFASQPDNSLSGELILSGNNTTTSTNGSQFQIKEPPIHFINSNIHEETHSTYGDTCSHSDWSSLYVCQYCKVNEVGVTTKPCGHNICGVCFQPQLQKLCAKEATLCRCCKWLITGFNTFFPRCS